MSLIIFSLLLSCSKQIDQPKTLDLSDKVLSQKVLNEVKLKITKLVNEKELNQNRAVNSLVTYSNGYEAEVETILQPLIENGRILHVEMIDFVSATQEFQQLSPEEQNELLYFDNSELATLSFVLSSENATTSMDGERIRACISVASGIAGIWELFADTAALGTARTAIGALRIIGRRYLGYWGVAMMIYEFAECMS